MRSRWMRSATFGAVFVIALALAPHASAAVLKVGTWVTPAQWHELYGDQMEAMQRALPHIELDVIQIAAHGEYAGKILLLAATGDLPDILHVPPEQAAPLAGALGVFENLEPWMARDPDFDVSAWLPPAREAITFQGVTFGIPAYVVNYAYAYNTEILAERGVEPPAPTEWPTWDQVRDIGRRATHDLDGDGVTDIWGYYHGLAFDFVLPLLYQMGGEIYDEEMRIRLDTPEMREAVNWLVDIVHNDRIHPPANSGIGRNGFYDQRIATMRFGSWEMNNVRNAGVPMAVSAGAQNRVKGEVAYVTTLGMTAGSRQKEAAWEFLKWITTVESQNYVVRRGRVPIRHDVEIPRDSGDLLNGLILALSHARTYPYHIESDIITRMFNQSMNAVWLGNQPAETVLPELERSINAYLAQPR